jgi:hypothetical protein
MSNYEELQKKLDAYTRAQLNSNTSSARQRELEQAITRLQDELDRDMYTQAVGTHKMMTNFPVQASAADFHGVDRSVMYRKVGWDVLPRWWIDEPHAPSPKEETHNEYGEISP